MHLLLFNLATDVDDPILGFTSRWIRALAEQVEHISVITMRAGRVEVPDNVSVYSVGKEKGYSEARRAVEFYRCLFHILRNNHIDACFAHMMPVFAVMGAPFLKARNIPITLWFTHRSVTVLLRIAEKLVDKIVTASPESFRIPSGKLIVTGHGIDTDMFVPRESSRGPDQPFTIVSVGRIAPIKHLDILIEALRILVKERQTDEVILRLVGGVYPHDEKYASELSQRIRGYGLKDAIEWVGFVIHSEVVKEYQNADVVVSLTPAGSLDKAPLEAMSCGVPILTSNVSFNDLIDRIDPNLFLPEANPNILADRLKRISDMDRNERQQLGEALRQKVVEHHGLKDLIRKLVVEIFPGD